MPSTWVNTTMKFAVRELNGNKVLVKTTEGSSLLSQARAHTWDRRIFQTTRSRLTSMPRKNGDNRAMGCDSATLRPGPLRQQPNASPEPWQPEVKRTVTMPFAWKPDTWYRMKLQVENLPDGKVRARGKVWLASEAEPPAWMIERIDPLPNRQGAPGIFGSALAELYFDNLKVYRNQ